MTAARTCWSGPSLDGKQPVASTSIVSIENLLMESPALAEQAYLQFVDTPRARPWPETEQTSGMMLSGGGAHPGR